MRAIMETSFDVVYLITTIVVGIYMISKGGKSNKEYKLFGIMSITLGLGDSFHLVPRAIALCTVGLDQFVVPLGIGKLITSITMTIFYIILYHVWRKRYNIVGQQKLTAAVYFMAAIRIILCLFPQNQWTSAMPPMSWAIARNIPFAILGLIIIVIFYKSAKANNDKAYRFMWLTIVLSFGFYIPVVLWADAIPAIGLLMIPKTCAYVWTIFIGLYDMRKNIKESK